MREMRPNRNVGWPNLLCSLTNQTPSRYSAAGTNTLKLARKGTAKLRSLPRYGIPTFSPRLGKVTVACPFSNDTRDTWKKYPDHTTAPAMTKPAMPCRQFHATGFSFQPSRFKTRTNKNANTNIGGV